MPDFLGMASRLFGQKQPVAYSRITRTPIYTDESMTDRGAQYDPGTKSITMNPTQMGMSIPHESAHAIFDAANLQRVGARLAGQVPADQAARVAAFPQLYDQRPETKADEGLGFSVGDRDAGGYVSAAASQITDPKLREQLLRLHENAVASHRLGGLGSLIRQ